MKLITLCSTSRAVAGGTGGLRKSRKSWQPTATRSGVKSGPQGTEPPGFPCRRGWRVSVLFGTLALFWLGAPSAKGQPQLQPLWYLDPGSRPYLPAYPGDNNQRGIAYNMVTGNLLLVNRTAGLEVRILEGTTGADIGTMNISGIAGGTLPLNQVHCGNRLPWAVYGANLVADSSVSPFKVYRWANETTEPVTVYSGPLLSGARWGDNMAIKCYENRVYLLFGQGGSGIGNHLAVLKSTDYGLTFTATVMSVEGLTPGETSGGLCFSRGNFFYCKEAGGTTLRYATFDLANGTARVVATSSLPTGLSGFGPLACRPETDILAAIQVNTDANPQTEPQRVYLFDVRDPRNPMPLDSEPFVSPGAQNRLATGAAELGGGKLYALDVNNGLRAYDTIGLGAFLVPYFNWDIGLRAFDVEGPEGGYGTNIVKIICEKPGPFGELESALRISKDGTTYGVTWSDVPIAYLRIPWGLEGYTEGYWHSSRLRIETPYGTRWLAKFTQLTLEP
jgi:hypothetical protein